MSEERGPTLKSVTKLSVVPKGYNQQAVDYLQTLVDQAKAGEILEIVCVSKLSDGQYEHCWTGCKDLHELVGQLARMQYLMIQRMNNHG